MKKYRRIEVNAFHRRVTVVSGDWRPENSFEREAQQTAEGVSLNSGEECEPVAPDSPEGQLILAEAVRTLEQRLTPETRALISVGEETLTSDPSRQTGFFLKLQSFLQLIWPKAYAPAQKEK